MTKLVRLLILMSMLVLLLALNVGVAFADHPVDGAIDAGAFRPVGNHLVGDVPGEPGFENGFGNTNSNAFTAIANNPLCPLHQPPSG